MHTDRTDTADTATGPAPVVMTHRPTSPADRSRSGAVAIATTPGTVRVLRWEPRRGTALSGLALLAGARVGGVR